MAAFAKSQHWLIPPLKKEYIEQLAENLHSDNSNFASHNKASFYSLPYKKKEKIFEVVAEIAITNLDIYEGFTADELFRTSRHNFCKLVYQEGMVPKPRHVFDYIELHSCLSQPNERASIKKVYNKGFDEMIIAALYYMIYYDIRCALLNNPRFSKSFVEPPTNETHTNKPRQNKK